jgi:hypothetical protein
MIQLDDSLRARLLLAATICAVLVGCGSGYQRPVAQPFAGPVSCGSEIAGKERLSVPLVLVGEIHGTQEIPAAFGRLVCRAAAERRGKTILVGMEILSSAQSAIDTFLASEGGASADHALLAQEFWQREYQDGRSSEAMFHLLDELRRDRKAGLKIVVRALDPQHYDSPSDRDAAMAASLIDAIAAVRPAQTLVLVGNVHTRILNGYPWDAKASYVPFGALLRARYDDLIALDVTTLGGSAWTCTSSSAADCGAHELRAHETTGPVPRVALDPAATPKTGYSGALIIGQVTASAPARLGTQEPR